jgi:hypothetical protein
MLQFCEEVLIFVLFFLRISWDPLLQTFCCCFFFFLVINLSFILIRITFYSLTHIEVGLMGPFSLEIGSLLPCLAMHMIGGAESSLLWFH